MKTKPTIIGVFLFLFFIALQTPIQAQFFCEDFEYPAGDTINNHGWVKFSGIGVNPVIITGLGLEQSCYAVTFGNAALLQTTGEDSYRILPMLTNSGNFYASMLVNFSAAQASGDFFFHLGDSVVNNSNKTARIYAKLLNGKVSIGLAKNNETPLYTAGIYDFGVTYLVVLKYEFVAGSDNDPISLFIFDEQHCPACNPEPAPTLGPTVGSGNDKDDLPNIGKIVLCQGAGAHSPTLFIDAICVDRLFCNNALPIELSSFSSVVNGSEVRLEWITSSETNNHEFVVERKHSETEWQTIGTVMGSGTTTMPHTYTYQDRSLMTGIYSYRLKQVDYNGNYEYFNLSQEVIIGTPTNYYLSQNYPNPFNPTTTITYNLPDEQYVTIKIFDISGKEVMNLMNNTLTPAGYHRLTLDATTLSSGIYFYRLTAGETYTNIKKMMVVK